MSRNTSLASLAGAVDTYPLAGFRNAIINGTFDVWQRGTSFLNPAAFTQLTADRWMPAYDGSGGTRTLSRQTFTNGQTDVPGEPAYFFRWDQSVAGTGATYNALLQRIESVRTFAGQQVTLSFYAKAAASLTMPSVFFNQTFGTGGSPSSSVYTPLVTNLVIGTSWTKFSITANVPSISGKTLGTNANDFLSVEFQLPLNSTFTLDLAQVQLELGPVATPFERRPYGTELALCQRYYTVLTRQLVYEGWLEAGYSAINNIALPVQLRATPSVTLIVQGSSNASGLNLNHVTPTTLRVQTQAVASGTAFVIYDVALSAEL